MANFGLSKPWIAELNAENDTYSKGFKCGSAMSTAVTPNFNEASLYADNQQKEYVKEFKNATVAVGVDRIPIKAAPILFGHTVAEDEEETSKSEDSSNYVGYGFITAEQVDGVKKYRACVLLKVKFSEGEESFTTKGDNIVFSAPTLSGIAIANNSGEWRKKSPYYATEDEADKWIQNLLSVKEEDGQQIYDENGEPEIYFTEPSVRAIAMVLPLMINEGLAVEAHRMGKEPEWVEDSKILTECDISYEYLAELIHEEYSTCFVTKKNSPGPPGKRNQ